MWGFLETVSDLPATAVSDLKKKGVCLFSSKCFLIIVSQTFLFYYKKSDSTTNKICSWQFTKILHYILQHWVNKFAF